MAFTKAPTELFSGYTSDGTNVTIPIASLEGLTTAAAHTTTGDLRAIALALEATLYSYYTGLATADRPAAFVARPLTQSFTSSGTFAGTVRMAYSFEFYTDLPVPAVVAEPT